MKFADRTAAGRVLAEALETGVWVDPLVLGLARGGLPVAHEVALSLGAELDVAVARKIGAPGHPEFGVGAVTAGGEPIFDAHALRTSGLTPEDLSSTCEAERREARRRLDVYRSGRAVRVTGRDVLIVDDGLATGVTARAALREAREAGPRRLVLAVPVGATQSLRHLGTEADLVVCPHERVDFRSVGRFYRRFDQTTDAEVLALLEQHRHD
ncbi:putative phosphoribosyltransferase [Saccharothrix tamanrassetensis]|uniref:Putative phosphoribosyltransferase n=1 Tax=Saccharothrix tamanrassetensis TaxID=1051531 RepID=A0A841CD76_9PSEU|nr:phosphoribosyltransferase family protein [Saccharothrix tamanrassetensis]MBB5954128.1 putative phosphoribosyltransferase [Saccharothrix tamanrassetensis]